jgi:predicted GNAT family acetyltransferase
MADVLIRDDPDRERYVAEVDGDLAGFTEYQLWKGRLLFPHTEIDDAYSGRGIATKLIREALDGVRSKGLMIVPLCPFVARFVRKNPDYMDMVDRELLKEIRQQSGR